MLEWGLTSSKAFISFRLQKFHEGMTAALNLIEEG